MSSTVVEDEEGGRLPMPAPGVKRYLAGYMSRDHLQGFVGETLGTRPQDEVDQFWERHLAATSEMGKAQPFSLDAGPLRLLEGSDAEWAKAVAATTTFQRSVMGAHFFAWVPLDKLIGYQPHIDAGQPMPTGTPEDILRWCLPLDFSKPQADAPQIIANPLWPGPRFVLATNDPNAQLACEVVDGVVQVSVAPRLNWLQVASVGPALVLRNGYHRACALATAGHTHAPALVVPMPNLGTAIPEQPGFFPAAYIQGLARPPMVLDLLSPQLTMEMAHAPQKSVFEVRLDVMNMRIRA